jgi:hypothetical protein
MPKSKSAFASQTILACLGTIAAGVITTANDPAFYSKAANCADQFGQNKISDLLRNGGKVLVMVLPIFGIAGRVKAGGLWTPSFMPGPNKNEVLEQEKSVAYLSPVEAQLLEKAKTGQLIPLEHLTEARSIAARVADIAKTAQQSIAIAPAAVAMVSVADKIRVLEEGWKAPV